MGLLRSASPSARSPGNDRGSVLVLSIWILVIFSVFATAISRLVMAQIRLARALEDRTISNYLALAAVVDTAKALSLEQDKFFTFQKAARLIQRPGTLKSGSFTRVSSIDEESKINLNTSPAGVIARLPGLDEEIAARIVESPLRPFSAVEVLSEIPGVTKDTLDGLKGLVTLHSSGRVNINTASAVALEVLGLDASLADNILAFRCGPDGESGTEDDGVFTSTAELLEKLRASLVMSVTEETSLLELANMLTVDATAYALTLKTEVVKRPAMTYNIVLDKDGIKQWEEF